MNAPVTSDPGIVWHYTDGPGLLGILARHVLWATSAAFLNDRDEVALGGQRVAARIQQLAGSDDSGIYARTATELRESSKESYAIGLDAGHPLSVLARPDPEAGPRTPDGDAGVPVVRSSISFRG